jgi:drug/metabolite transporter (DMT)-like permease
MESRALVLVLASAAMHAGWNVLAKREGDPTAFLLAMEATSIVLLSPVLPFLVPLSEIPLEIFGILAASSLLHAFYAIWLARAYAREDLTIVYPIVRSAPALAAALAWAALGERLSPSGVTAIALVIAGVWLLRSGRDDRATPGPTGGVYFALLALGATVAYSVVDKAGVGAMDDLPTVAAPAIAYMALVYLPYVVALAALALRDRSPPALLAGLRRAMPRAAFGGLLGLAAYALILEALRSAPVGYVVAARQASIPLAAIMAVTVTKERISARRGVGLGIVTLGVAWLGLV